MDAFRIEGPARLEGTIRPAGNKNAALPILACALLAEDPVILSNLPDIGDVRTMLDILVGLGVSVTKLADDKVRLHAKTPLSTEPDPALTSRIRASFLLAAPLAVRMGEVRIRRPGGDLIGRRRLDTHITALRALGIETDIGDTSYSLKVDPDRLRGASLFLDEASVTATEHALCVAARARGTTYIRNAASEPHVQEVCRFLRLLGARIEGIGTNLLRVEGVPRLGGGEHTIGPDHIEVGSWIGLAAVTKSAIRIENAAPDDHEMTAVGFGRLGVSWRVEGNDIVVPADQPLTVTDDIGGAIPKIDDAPWPGFPADLVSIAVVVATQARGTILIHEKMFESRLFFVDKLVAMGARIILCDPHRAVVMGPSELRGSELTSPDIRAGMALLIAALCAEGVSTIRNVRQIDRGYERIDERLRKLGAKITRVND